MNTGNSGWGRTCGGKATGSMGQGRNHGGGMAHGQAGPNSAGATGSPLSSRFACSATCFAWCRRGRAQNHSQQGPAWRSGPHRRQGPFRTVRRELLSPRGFPHTNRHGERLGATCILSMPWPATALAGVRSVSHEQVFCGFSTVWTLRSDTIWLQEWGWGWGGLRFLTATKCQKSAERGEPSPSTALAWGSAALWPPVPQGC